VVEFGAVPTSQFTTWQELMEFGQRAERLGFASLWAPDHLVGTMGPHRVARFEAFLVLAGWAPITSRATLGLSVASNTFRNPALTAKMVTTLDHLSGGRAVMGIGAGWHELEHELYGLEFGSSPGERLDWLDEAARIIRGMLNGEEPSGSSRYTVSMAPNVPPPVQARLPLMIGGAGERKTLRTVARYADIWNLPVEDGGVAGARRKIEVLYEWCQREGRDPAEIDWILNCGLVALRDTHDEADGVIKAQYQRNGVTEEPDRPFFTGPSDEFAELLHEFVRLGFKRINVAALPPFDFETLERLMSEVRPRLETLTADSRPTSAPPPSRFGSSA
jgi:alkanesulfonate monooxygenase SsuD/methylene tetrahydromethanopterin reductase-like flavin-dependent oxidoreductase (luciferase family)